MCCLTLTLTLTLGCEIEPYLLEKNRVSSQQKGECLTPI